MGEGGPACGSAYAGGGVIALGAREGNWIFAGGRGRLLKAQGTRKEKAPLPTKWFLRLLIGR